MKEYSKSNSVRIFALLAFIAILGFNAMAQDVITLKDGSEINALVQEIGTDEVKYKKWDNKNGPNYTMKKSEIFMIKYQNGSKDVFNEAAKPQETKQESASQPQQNYSQSIQPQTQTKAYSQKSDGGFSLHLGGAFPMGEFGEETTDLDEYEKFSASIGFNVGIKGKIPLQVKGLGIFISGDFIFNGLKGKIKDYYDEAATEYDELQRCRYINVPMFVGLNYKYNINSQFGIWCEGGLGVDIRKITSVKYVSGDESIKMKYNMQASFAFQVGGGIMIKDVFSIGVHYYGLGKSKIKGKVTYSDSDDSDYEPFSYPRKCAQNCLVVRLGFHF